MDKCIMCGTGITEGRQVCWSCEFRAMKKCERCKYEDTDVCLKMDCWRNSGYETNRRRH